MATTRRRRSTSRTTARRRAPVRRRRTTARRKTRKKAVQFKLSEHVSREISGIFCIGFGILNFLAIQQNAGSVGALWTENILTPIFGLGSLVVPAFFIVVGIVTLVNSKVIFGFGRLLGMGMLIVSGLSLVQLSAPLDSLFTSSASYGGYIGFTVDLILYSLFGQTGTTVILTVASLVSLLLIFNISLSELMSFFTHEIEPGLVEKISNKDRKTKAIKEDSSKKEPDGFALNIVRRNEEKLETIVGKDKNKKNLEPEALKKEVIPITTEKPPNVELIPEEQPKVDYSNYELPDIRLLKTDPKNKSYEDDQLVENAEIIRRKLDQFKVSVTMKDAHVGPTVIQYTLKPAEDVKLSKITSLKNDLALALSAEAIRIEAPIPGKGLVGIEIPAHERSTVHLGSVIRSSLFQNQDDGYLKVALGRDVSGKPVVGDLTKMPHVLVAGQTGSGKSIGINSFLVSLLYRHTPADLRLILIDPKRVELTTYNGIPHLLTPVITEPDKALQSLKWTVSEMNRRYKELARHGKRNMEEYNAAFPTNKMPFIVIVIDELADLMMAASKEIEATICRLAQMARAVGIHLIIATQRPSVDVITGLIKANIPTRIAYTVATGVDSRTVIDCIGAEDLLGKGDMLYLASNMAKPMRMQGTFITTNEVEKIINFIKINSPTGVQYDETITEEHPNVKIPGLSPASSSSIGSGGESDLEKAIQAIREGKKASASFLQRRCSFGYAKAARILDQLEEMGLIGPSNGAKARAIYISEEAEAPSQEHPNTEFATQESG